MADGASSKLIWAFLCLILGVALLTTIAGQVQDRTTTTGVTDETLNIAAARLNAANNINVTRNFTLQNPGLADAGGIELNSIIIENGSGLVIAPTNYTVDYTVYPDRISFLNTTYMISGGGSSNITFITYEYYPNDYLNQAWGRTVLNTVVGFFALALMLVGVALFYSVYQDNF